MTENDDIELKIKAMLEQFSELRNTDDVSVDIKHDSEGRFLVEVKSKAKMATVKHAWNDKQFDYENPGTIDIVFYDRKERRSFFLIMTESDITDFPVLLQNAFMLLDAFLKGEYSEETRSFLFFKRSSLKFNLSPTAIYKYASQTKQYLDPSI